MLAKTVHHTSAIKIGKAGDLARTSELPLLVHCQCPNVVPGIVSRYGTHLTGAFFPSRLPTTATELGVGNFRLVLLYSVFQSVIVRQRTGCVTQLVGSQSLFSCAAHTATHFPTLNQKSPMVRF